jgi:hypothetical protein
MPHTDPASPPKKIQIRIFYIQLFCKLDKLNFLLVIWYVRRLKSKVGSSRRLSSFIICNRGSELMDNNCTSVRKFMSEITGQISITLIL